MKMSLSQAAKAYLQKQVEKYELDQLNAVDAAQLFQDLLDTGMIANYPNHQAMVTRLINVGLVKSTLNQTVLN